jgi:hypothetical protein
VTARPAGTAREAADMEAVQARAAASLVEPMLNRDKAILENI